jgi:hypothetical protein
MKTKVLCVTFLFLFALVGCGTVPVEVRAAGPLEESSTITSKDTAVFLETSYGFGVKDMPSMVCKKDGPVSPRSGKKGWAVCQSSLRGDYVSANWVDITTPRSAYQMAVVRDFLKSLSFSGSSIPKTTCEWDKTFIDSSSGMNGVFIDCTTEASPSQGLSSQVYISFFYFVNNKRKDISETIQNILVFSEATSFEKVNREQFIGRTRSFIASGRLFTYP